jgi:UDP-2-acetamido-3-amino-2,3-dideoxy-glucuronate N-acetyltransferase
MSGIQESAEIATSATIGPGSRVWHFSQLGEYCKVGANVSIGRNVFVGEGVVIGDNCKIQNSALLYAPARLEAGVFVGPGVILTNDAYPRAVNPDGSQKALSDWKPVGVSIREGASIGAGSICIAPVEIGEWALVAAGSVVTSNIPAFALVAGVPAKRLNWVGRAGFPLMFVGDGHYVCPETGARYFEYESDRLKEILE